jgi:hypothetical protein
MKLRTRAAWVVGIYSVACLVFMLLVFAVTPTVVDMWPDGYTVVSEATWPAAFHTGAQLAGALTASALLIHAAFLRERRGPTTG